MLLLFGLFVSICSCSDSYHWIAHIDTPSRNSIPFTLNNKNGYLIKYNTSTWTAIENICLHRGATLKISKNCLVCPYHGWKYDLKGNLIVIPGIANIPNSSIQSFQTEVQYNNIFIKPHFLSNNNSLNEIFFPPEELDVSFRPIYGERRFYRPSTMVMENLLDMIHWFHLISN